MEYEITSGAVFYYGGIGTSFGTLRFRFTMTDPVDPEILEYAVNTAMKRFPHFCIRPEIKDGRYVQVHNDKPFKVFVGEEGPNIGSAEANYHMFSFGCHGNYIYADWFHGVADGKGSMMAMHSILYYYCLKRYGGPINSPGVILADSEASEEDYADPNMIALKYLDPDMTPPKREELFSIPEERVGPDDYQTLYTINMPQNAFVKYTKSVDGSPAVMAALFLCRAMAAVHPETDKIIAASLPVDLRSMLGCETTGQNCVNSINMMYTDRLRKLPLDRQATCFRGIVFVNSDPDTILPAFAGRAKMEIELKHKGGLEDKAAVFNSGVPPIPVASYMGVQDFGDVEKYRTHFCMLSDVRTNGMMLNLFTAGDTLTFNLQCGLKTDAYFKALVNELEQAGVEFSCPEPIKYKPIKRIF